MGLNNLVEEWKEYRNECRDSSNPDCASGFESCRQDLFRIIDTAWHLVSEPPVKKDMGQILALDTKNDTFSIHQFPWLYLLEMSEWKNADEFLWARISDVVLLPGDK